MGTVLEQNAGMTVAPGRWLDVFAVLAGAGRLASGVSFLIAPETAHRWWGGPEDAGPTTNLLLRSMGTAMRSSADCCFRPASAAARQPAGSWRRRVPMPPTSWAAWRTSTA